METKLLDEGSGRWCVHTVEGDVHLANIHYRGSGDWRCTVARGTSEEDHEHDVEWALVANTVEEAYAEAVKKATENGVIPKLEEIKRETGKIPTAEEAEAIDRKEAAKDVTPEMLLRSMMMHTLQNFQSHAARIGKSSLFITSLKDVLLSSLVDHLPEEKMDEAVAVLIKEVQMKTAEYRKQKAELENAKKAFLSQLSKVFGSENDDPPEPPKH